jgi:hypothetical protein
MGKFINPTIGDSNVKKGNEINAEYGFIHKFIKQSNAIKIDVEVIKLSGIEINFITTGIVQSKPIITS